MNHRNSIVCDFFLLQVDDNQKIVSKMNSNLFCFLICKSTCLVCVLGIYLFCYWFCPKEQKQIQMQKLYASDETVNISHHH